MYSRESGRYSKTSEKGYLTIIQALGYYINLKKVCLQGCALFRRFTVGHGAFPEVLFQRNIVLGVLYGLG